MVIMANEVAIYRKNLRDPKFGIYVDLAKIEKNQYGSYKKVKENCSTKMLSIIGEEGFTLNKDEFCQLCDELEREN